MRIGDVEVLPIRDGTFTLTPDRFFPGADWSAHQALLDDEGTMKLPIGCFVVRTGDRTVLVDAGFGPRDAGWLVGGGLPDALATAGVDRTEIDTVVCTHLHGDHAGWLVHDDEPFFPNATVRFGAGDWDQLVTGADERSFVRAAMLRLQERDRLQPIDRDGEPIAPGITARFAPGHTHGHHVLVVSSGAERLLLLGDAVHCPLQLEETDWQAIGDVDPDLAARTRQALFDELEGTGDRFSAAHFPDLRFGRALGGSGRRWFA